MLNRGDVLIGMTGYVGDVARVDTDLPLVLNQRVGRVSIRDNERFLLDYLFYALRLPASREQVRSLSHGSAQANISAHLMGKVQIPSPDLDNQRAIASVLGALDDEFASNRRVGRLLEETVELIFTDWFVSFGPVRRQDAGSDQREGDASADGLFPSGLRTDGVPLGWDTESLESALDASSERVDGRAIPEYSCTNTGVKPRSDRFRLSRPVENEPLFTG